MRKRVLALLCALLTLLPTAVFATIQILPNQRGTVNKSGEMIYRGEPWQYDVEKKAPILVLPNGEVRYFPDSEKGYSIEFLD